MKYYLFDISDCQLYVDDLFPYGWSQVQVEWFFRSYCDSHEDAEEA